MKSPSASPPSVVVGAMTPEPPPVYEFDGFRFDPQRRLLARTDGTPIALSGQAFDALHELVRHAGQLVPRASLVDTLWPTTVVEENSLTQTISSLRRAIGEGHVVTVVGRGYQFVSEVRVLSSTVAYGGTDVPQSSGTGSANALAGRPRSLVRGLAAATLLLVGGASLLAFEWRARRSEILDPLSAASFRRLTDFEGAEEHAAVSRDGRFVTFLSDRDGRWDVWVGQIGTGDFRNLTQGAVEEVRNPAVRTLAFSPDGSLVILWTRKANQNGGGTVDAGWALPTVGGALRPYLPNVAELDWSRDGRRIVYHTSADGDPLFVTEVVHRNARQIYAAPRGVHCHFPVWSADGELIYFVKGESPDEMDLWRIGANGGEPEQLTFHNSRVSFPVLLNRRTLLYLATAPDGSGPWIHAIDLERRVTRRLNTGVDEYRSLAASADGRRLVATIARRTSGLWRAALDASPVGVAMSLAVPTTLSSSPRTASGVLVYRATKSGRNALWKLGAGAAIEMWSDDAARMTAGPALSRDGRLAAFPVQKKGVTRLNVVNTDGGDLRTIADLEVRGSPTWSPDGRWIAITALRDGAPRLFKIPAEGGIPVMLGNDSAHDPVWSPTGEFLVYSGPDIGTNFTLAAVNADGTPRAVPRIELSRGSRRLDFLGDTNELVFLKGNLSHKEFWALDLDTGSERPLSAFGAGQTIVDFDVAADGREIVFDRGRDASDLVLIDLPAA